MLLSEVHIFFSHHKEWLAVQNREISEISVKFEIDDESFLTK